MGRSARVLIPASGASRYRINHHPRQWREMKGHYYVKHQIRHAPPVGYIYNHHLSVGVALLPNRFYIQRLRLHGCLFGLVLSAPCFPMGDRQTERGGCIMTQAIEIPRARFVICKKLNMKELMRDMRLCSCSSCSYVFYTRQADDICTLCKMNKKRLAS